MNIGVLAIQGDFNLHLKMLAKLHIQGIPVRNPGQLTACEGLILPGGESTTFIKLLKEINLYQALSEFGKKKCIFGTCAGLITLAKNVLNPPTESLGLLDVDVQRNAYGRQIDSFVDNIALNLNHKKILFEGIFIRAPKISRVGEHVKKLAVHRTNVVMVETERILAATFHPELTDNPIIHQYFLDKVSNAGKL